MRNTLLLVLLLASSAWSQSYNLVWSDEFEGNSLDLGKWEYEVDCWGGGNAELQCYTSRSQNIRVGGGVLTIEAKPERFQGSNAGCTNNNENSCTWTRDYTSGRVHSKFSNGASWKYGKIETRAKLPKGNFLWPAIWMLPSDNRYGGWAASGEIDIMEARGQVSDKIEGTLHFGGAWPNNRFEGSGPVNVAGINDYSNDFHTFSVVWTETQVQWFVDGTLYRTATLERSFYSGAGSNPYNANRQPFDQRFHMLLNVAVGGGFFPAAQYGTVNGQSAGTWVNPTMQVDWVRVYQLGPANPPPPSVVATTVAPTQPPSTSTLGPRCNNQALTPQGVVTSPYWLESMTHNGNAVYNANPATYPVFRNVRDWGAIPDDNIDDTDAIQRAIDAGGRCGYDCDSSTIQPALVYFPAGTYIISKEIIQPYFTQLVGDPTRKPVLKAAANLPNNIINSNPYPGETEAWQNQNNFFRQIRNFVFDLRPSGAGTQTGIHWQVAQATSLTNLEFWLNSDDQAIFMENGSGGWIADITIHGGKFGLWIGSQQFTTRNLYVENTQTAVFMIWDWGWTFTGVNIVNCVTAFDVSSQDVGSVLIGDATISNTNTGVLVHSGQQTKPGASTLTLDNVKFVNVQTGVKTNTGATLLTGGSKTINSWAKGAVYRSTGTWETIAGDLPAPTKSDNLMNSGRTGWFQKPKPQYEAYRSSDVINVKNAGVKGDGNSDDTAALRQVIADYAGCKIIFIPHGTYVVTDTIFVPVGSRIIGEHWPVLIASGANFANANAPRVVFKFGNQGDAGVLEVVDIVFATRGQTGGAILIEWNVHESFPGSCGMWDAHTRVGGYKGTNQQVGDCPKFTNTPKLECMVAFMLMHITPAGSGYFENVWGWTSDHDLDVVTSSPQISIYAGRGLLVESSNGPVWLYGTSFEHNVLYQYNIVNAQNVWMGMIQTETPYFQPVPIAPIPFASNSAYKDPVFNCPNGGTCAESYGLRIANSGRIYVYGAGLYNFFNYYTQQCLDTEDCQVRMVELKGVTDRSQIYIYNLNTKAATIMVQANGIDYMPQSRHRSNFCSTIAADLSWAQGSYVPPTGLPTTTINGPVSTNAPPAATSTPPVPTTNVESSCTDFGGGTGSGLQATYFSDQNLGTAVLTRVDPTIGFDWGTGSPAAGVPADRFSIRWQGQIQPRMSGPWSFQSTSDDGVRVWVNNVLIIDAWRDQGSTSFVGTIPLARGVKYPIKMEYYDNQVGAIVFLKWSHPCATSFVLPPAAQLYPVAATAAVRSDECRSFLGSGKGLSGEYSNLVNAGVVSTGGQNVTLNEKGGVTWAVVNATVSLVDTSVTAVTKQIEGPIDFHWTDSPVTGVKFAGFTVKWTGFFQAPLAGDYKFYTSSGNGVRVTVNGNVIIDNMNLHSPTDDVSSVIKMTYGGSYPISIEFVHVEGDAVLSLAYSVENCMEKTVIPVNQLYDQTPPPPPVDEFEAAGSFLFASLAILFFLAF